MNYFFLANDMSAGEIILLVIGLLIATVISFFVYFLPSIIAFLRGHHFAIIIFAINLIFGATGLGYFIALIWAVWPKKTGLAALAQGALSDPTANPEEIRARGGIVDRAKKHLYTAKVYVQHAGQQSGPFSREELIPLLMRGEISYDDTCWSEGKETWQPISHYATEWNLPPRP